MALRTLRQGPIPDLGPDLIPNLGPRPAILIQVWRTSHTQEVT